MENSIWPCIFRLPILRHTFLSIVFLALVGCAANLASYQIPSSSYTIEGRNYTFAVYNSENRLITHPLADLKHEIERRKSAGKKPISDIYVIAHGWNYSGGLAVTSYHGYIELLDKLIAEKQVQAEYQPFLIFVTWTSTVRPLGDVANAVLPLNTHEIIRPLTNLMDEGPIHLLTAWKQSLNAGTIALGRFGADAYLDYDWNDFAYYYEEGWYGERDTGQEHPLSQLVYELMDSKISNMLNTNELTPAQQTLKPCLTPPHSDQNYLPKQALADVKIHLVGHSYGAKLVAFAGMEGIRKWVLRKYLGYPVLKEEYIKKLIPCFPELAPYEGRRTVLFNQKQTHLGNQNVFEQTVDTLLNYDPLLNLERRLERSVPTILFNERQSQKRRMGSLLTGEQGASEQVVSSLLKDNPVLLTDSPIESLVLYSPAMHAGEFEYPTSLGRFATSGTLKLIRRKAILYSRYDRANGLAFNFRDLLLNAQVAQAFQSAVSRFDLEFPAKAMRMAGATVYGLGGSAYSVIYGSSFYAIALLTQTPADFYYHMNNYTFDGAFEPPIKSSLLPGIGKRLLNAADYFVPVWPFVLSRQEDETGIFRLVRPGLGKVGLKRLATGRNEMLSLWNLRDFYGYSRDINAERFCKFSGKLLEATPILTDSGLVYLKDEILSFDASSVYNSGLSLDGSHGDIRGLDNASCNRVHHGSELQKREHSMMFLVNFTTSDYMKWLEEN